jgi:hypothetical protein
MFFKEDLGLASKIISSRPASGMLGSPVRCMSSAAKCERYMKRWLEMGKNERQYRKQSESLADE